MKHFGVNAAVFVCIVQVPPEMSRPRTMDELKAGDCWAVGVIAYILITGGPPFDGKNKEQIFSNICNKERKLRFPKGVTVSFRSFIRSLLSHDISKRLTAAQALDHSWISGDGASTNTLSSSYIQSLQKFNRGNKLQNILVSACLKRVTSEDKKEMERDLIAINRNTKEMRDSDVVNYLLLRTKVTVLDVHYGQEPLENDEKVDEESEQKESDQNLADRMMAVVDDVVESFGNSIFWATKTEDEIPSEKEIPSENDSPSENPRLSHWRSAPAAPGQIHHQRSSSMGFPAQKKGSHFKTRSCSLPRREAASEEEIFTRKISGQRFSAIMSSTPYDVTALMKDLVDSDGMIPLDEIAQYDMRTDDETDTESES